MNPPRPFHRPTPGNQRGAASVAIAMLIMLILAAAVVTSMIMSSSSVRDASINEEQIAALFLAESGLERAQGILAAAPDPTVQDVCAKDIAGTSATRPLGRGSFTLTGAATGCDTTVNPVANCTSCTVTSTGTIGTIGSSSRTIVRVISVSATSGGAVGCGGGGVTPVVCPVSNVPASQLNPNIQQDIEVTTPPAVVLSNMSYLRHPSGGANNVDAAPSCVTDSPGGLPCFTQWNDQSNSSSGSSVVGSRGASAVVTAAGTYSLIQNLTADSFFAAIGAKFGLSGCTTDCIVGSYWSDTSSTGGTTSVNGSTMSGATNNGAACATPGVPDLTTCPNLTTPPVTIGSGSRQTSRNWCNDADTLVLGFSGASSNTQNGALIGFTFGTSGTFGPSLVPAGNSVAQYPKPVTGTNSQLYSALRYIYNPSYFSANDAVSGAVATGSAGATFTAALTKSGSYLAATSVIGALQDGSVISVAGLKTGTILTFCTTSPISGISCGNGGAGAYLTDDKPSANASGVSASATSSVLTITFAPDPRHYLADGDTIYYNSNTTGATVTVPALSAGGGGTYNLSKQVLISSSTNNVTSNGTTVVTASSTPSTGPTVGKPIAIRWTGSGTGGLAVGTTVASVDATGTSFKLSARPTTPLSGVQLCGGICAYFDHSSAAATTNFTITISGTSQWAAGMTCLKGVNPSDIVGLTGASASVKATDWHEVVK